jgi:ketosteroid isomerase-like protein
MTLTPPGAPGPVNDRGKYMVVWKRQADGSWKIHRDMFNTNLGQ